MRFKYSESFPSASECPDVESAVRLIRKIIDERMAEEILKRLPKERASDIA